MTIPLILALSMSLADTASGTRVRPPLPAATVAGRGTVPTRLTFHLLDSLRQLDARSLDSLNRQIDLQDSILRERDRTLADTRDSLVLFARRLDTAAARHSADTMWHRILSDSIARFHRVDTLAIQIDTIRISDPDLAADSAMLRDLLVTAAANSGRNVVCRPLVAGIRNSVSLQATLRRTQDSVWLRIDLGGRVVADSIRLSHAGKPSLRDGERIPRMERAVVRTLFGDHSVPPEPKGPWHWAVRAGIVASVALAATIAMVVL